MTSRVQHLPALDGLRAVAVFVVILGHAGVLVGVPGDLGVTLFFVLSGFLITWLLLRECDQTGTVSFRAFYRRRTLRIFPAYYAFILLSLAADTLLHHPWSAGLLTAAVTYTVNYYNAVLGHPVTSVAHAWSLAVEEQFYLLWPVACLALWRRGRSVTARALLAVLALSLAWRCVLVLMLHAPASYVYNAFETRADALAIGCLMAVCAGAPWYQRALVRLRASAWLPCLTLAALLLSRLGGGDRYHYTLGFTVDALLLAVLLAQLLGVSHAVGWAWLNHPITRWLGAISYPCYLWHGWGFAVWHHLWQGGPAWLAFVVGYAVTVLLAAGSYYLVERPCLHGRGASNGHGLRAGLGVGRLVRIVQAVRD